MVQLWKTVQLFLKKSRFLEGTGAAHGESHVEKDQPAKPAGLPARAGSSLPAV